MKLKANDTLHVSSVKADNLLTGEVFEVEDSIGEDLIKRKLATKVDDDAEVGPSATKAAANKGATPTKKKG